MYKPARESWETYLKLKELKIWEKAERIFNKYKQKWQGPEIPVYIFPMDKGDFSLLQEGNGKSGVSFKQGVFLFLTPVEDEKELEALFVHEYHHVCRMAGQEKQLTEYTLLDSMVLEGLAEHAVAVECGSQYVGKWCSKYSEEELGLLWKRYLSSHLEIKKLEMLHDQLLFGMGKYPKLLGYAAGYELVKQYRQHKNFTEKASFTIPSEKLLNYVRF